VGVFAGPDINENGLVLALDAANPKGYDNYENLVKNSQTFENWTANGSRATITTNQIVAPDGSLTADMIEDANSNSGFKNLYQYITITSTETYTASLYVKAGTSDWANFYFDDTKVSFQFSTETILLDPNSGNLGGTGTATAGFDNVGNGWYRLYLKDVYASSAFRPFGIWTGANSQTYNPSYIGDPQYNFYIWGAQLERGSSVTDYYATTSTTKTRGTTWGDLSGNGNNGTLVNGVGFGGGNGGSLSFDGVDDYVTLGTPSLMNGVQVPLTICVWAKANALGSYNVLWGVDKSTTGGGLYSMLRVDFGQIRYFTTNYLGGIQVNGNVFSVSTGVWNFYAVTVSGTISSPSVTIYLNNSSSTLSYSTLSSSPDLTVDFRIGSNQRAGEDWNGNISNALWYNRALTSTEIQQNFNALRGRYGI